MIIKDHYLIYNNCYKAATPLQGFKGVLIHDTATPGATIDRFLTSWNVPKPNNNSVCVHAFCDDTQVVNTLPYNIQCWGCGSGSKGSGNRSYIQIEMCVPRSVVISSGWKYEINPGMVDAAKKYISDIVEVVTTWAANTLYSKGVYTVDSTTVTSHYEAHSMGIASNHSDPAGFLALGGYTMDYIRERVREKLNLLMGNSTGLSVGDNVTLLTGAVQYDGGPIKSDYLTKVYEVKSISGDRVVLSIDGVTIYAVNSKYIKLLRDEEPTFLVRVNADVLNIRSGPGTSYSVVGQIKDNGVYTIIESQGTWGKLKSGAGWISLNYTTKLG